MEGLDAQEAELAEEREEGGEDKETVAGLGAGTAPAAADASLAEALAERDARIRELEGRVAEAARSAAAAEELRSQIEELKRQGEEQRVDFALTLADAVRKVFVYAFGVGYEDAVGRRMVRTAAPDVEALTSKWLPAFPKEGGEPFACLCWRADRLRRNSAYCGRRGWRIGAISIPAWAGGQIRQQLRRRLEMLRRSCWGALTGPCGGGVAFWLSKVLAQEISSFPFWCCGRGSCMSMKLAYGEADHVETQTKRMKT